MTPSFCPKSASYLSTLLAKDLVLKALALISGKIIKMRLHQERDNYKLTVSKLFSQ